jgi:16S rRNA (adenine1518-N6/adenine1519-N6)-dimethyltransferase
VAFLSLDEIKVILKQYNLRPSQDRGQNFLTDLGMISAMADFIPKDESVLEIGPGLGHFTSALYQRTKNIRVFELDKGFYEYLNGNYSHLIRLVHGDFLKYRFDDIGEPTTVVGNIPYNLSLEMTLHLIKHKALIKEFYLLVQKEYAQKVISTPEDQRYGRISALAQFYTKPEIILEVGKGSFFPAPNVDSVFMRFTPNERAYDEKFVQFVNHLFHTRRKKMTNLLKGKYDPDKILSSYQKLKFSLDIRAEELDVKQLYDLYLGLQ